jgi:hypothetical protein
MDLDMDFRECKIRAQERKYAYWTWHYGHLQNECPMRRGLVVKEMREVASILRVMDAEKAMQIQHPNQ